MKITITESQYNKLMEGFVNIPVDEDVALELWEDEKKLELSSIVIPKHLRGQGKGTEVMNKVIEYSEEVNKPIYLTPDTNFGGTSINRLKRFYRRFGFTKNTDQEVSHSMVRYPKGMNESQTTKIILKEYSSKLIDVLVNKFKQESPNLEKDIIISYINRFVQIKNSPKVLEKDITKYTWKQLETVVDSNQPKRIKAGKINDGEPGGDSNLVYNENGLRIYIGKTKNACIKYGNGYSFCISSRGQESMYTYYRYDLVGTPYFIFDDTKTSEQDKYGNFIDTDHLLVLFVHEPTYKGGDFWYTVTTADNQGEEEFDIFNKIEDKYPRLKGMKELFKPVEVDPKEKKLFGLDKKYNSLLRDLIINFQKLYHQITTSNNFNFEDIPDDFPFYETIDTANKFIDDEVNGEIEHYTFHGKSDMWDESLYKMLRVRNKEDYNRKYEEFSSMAIKALEPDKDIKITVTKFDLSMPLKKWYKDYLLGVKKIVDEYRSELSKTNLLNEMNIKDKTIINHGVEHNIYKSIKYPNKLIKVGPDFIVNEWYYMFEENPDIFPKVYGMYPLKNREWINKIGIKPSQQANFFDESEYYYVVIEELDTKKFMNLWNRMNDVNREIQEVSLIDMMEYDGYEENWDNLLDHTKDSNIFHEIEMFYSLIQRLHEVKDGPDLHEKQFGFDSEGILKALDI